MAKEKKILILGASSFIGKHLYDKLGPEKSTGTYNSHTVEGCIHFDALTMNVRDIIRGNLFYSHAVILLGNTKPDSCAKNIKDTTYLNVTRICKIIDELKKLEITPVFISTEAVFDGKKGNYVETDEVNPILVYATQKVEVEKYLQNNCRRFIIARLAKVYGCGLNDGTMFTAWLKQMRDSEKIICARDSIFSPIHVDDANEALRRLIENNCNGIFHLANKDAYSRLEMLNTLIKYYKKYCQNETRITECSILDLPTVEKRPLNISLIPKKLIRETNIDIRDIQESCEYITRKAFNNPN